MKDITMKDITIKVCGLSNTGKSTITYLIKEFLKENGFNVTQDLIYDFENELEYDKDAKLNLDKKIYALREKTNINLQEIPLYKNLEGGYNEVNIKKI